MGTENRKGPLKDVKVLDFTIALAGVYVAWQFADMGAEVWKVERYGSGDQARTWDPFVNGNIRFYKGCAVAVAHPFIGFIPGSFQPVPLFLSQVFT